MTDSLDCGVRQLRRSILINRALLAFVFVVMVAGFVYAGMGYGTAPGLPGVSDMVFAFVITFGAFAYQFIIDRKRQRELMHLKKEIQSRKLASGA